MREAVAAIEPLVSAWIFRGRWSAVCARMLRSELVLVADKAAVGLVRINDDVLNAGHRPWYPVH